MKKELFVEKCRENKIKVTDQRLAIYKELAGSLEHPSADKIFKKVRKNFPNISFDTVNRTVLTFAEIGLIRMVEGYGDFRRFDPDTDPHHHLWCVRCHKITDFHDKHYDKIKIPKKPTKNFKVISKKVVLEGLCKKCQSFKGGRRV